MDIVLNKDYAGFKKGDLLKQRDHSSCKSLIRDGIAREASLDDLALGFDSTKKVKKAKKTQSKEK